MACKRLGCCGGFLNFLVGYWNFGWLSMGGSLIVAAMIFRYGNFDVNLVFTDSDVMTNLLNWHRSTLEIANLVVIGAGAVLMLMGLIGLIGACFTNRCFLVLFEIFAIIVFIAHTAGFAYALIKADDLGHGVQTSIGGAVFDINKRYGDYEGKCRGLLKFSKLLSCCGVESPFEIENEQDREACCGYISLYNYEGCRVALSKFAKSVGLYSFVLPNAILLASELFYIVATPFLIKRITRRKD